MKSVCPFVKAARPDDALLKKACESPKQQVGHDVKPKQESAEPGIISPKCPFGHDVKPKQESAEPGIISPKCPFGYDSQTFKLGPFSCMICQSLLFDSSKCMPCSHAFCKACISRFKDCPLCGADIETIEPNPDLQKLVDQFIDGHARIKRSQANTDSEDTHSEKSTIIYEDVSIERGAFLVQQAMRAFRARNIESAKHRLSLCAEDIREQFDKVGSTSDLCSQLGAVLGMLGDCCRALEDSASAVSYFKESVDFLFKVQSDDLEVIHTLSVSLNKIGDLKYYEGDLEAARSYYSQSLDVRRDAIKKLSSSPSQTLDVAVSLAKIADLDRNIGNEDVAVAGFQEAVTLLESLTLNAGEASLENRRLTVLEFLKKQLDEKEHQPTS